VADQFRHARSLRGHHTIKIVGINYNTGGPNYPYRSCGNDADRPASLLRWEENYRGVEKIILTEQVKFLFNQIFLIRRK
jgi:hypothetical protein